MMILWSIFLFATVISLTLFLLELTSLKSMLKYYRHYTITDIAEIKSSTVKVIFYLCFILFFIGLLITIVQ